MTTREEFLERIETEWSKVKIVTWRSSPVSSLCSTAWSRVSQLQT